MQEDIMDVGMLRLELSKAKGTLAQAEKNVSDLFQQLLAATAIGWVCFGKNVFPVSPEGATGTDSRKFKVHKGVAQIYIYEAVGKHELRTIFHLSPGDNQIEDGEDDERPPLCVFLGTREEAEKVAAKKRAR